MDDTPIVPIGPRKVAPKNQVSIPAELLGAMGIVVGDDVFFVLNPDRPGTVVMMPRSVMAEVFRKGWTSVS